MGEIADLMISGEICEGCQCELDGDAPGHPRYCAGCAPRDADCSYPKVPSISSKVRCTVCGKKVKRAGEADHMRDVHGVLRPVDCARISAAVKAKGAAQ